ncbi:right-handed parallel beta-helix repeat-containing protein [Fulvivirgaceae bacterium PWU4]|uniref:Right-handed parallel beta-helix repeat-containing protein n=1 Tax=Chryseosolibacter histidini TaxID=2782349 RepID=A0AAP2GN72_9BACT|nr:parallel beta-helix domain-containing protein [Chryseosolibacter histidini]MBT1697718.1 right-handed parallel beta-helix repeat-containing protein [Chryseosolibacter histidini]
MKPPFILAVLIALTIPAHAQKEIQKKFQTQFIEAANGSTIELPAGRFQMDASLWLDGKKNVTIKGAGEDKTIISFKGQISGAEGIKITNASDITVRDLTVQDAKGDGIKTQLVDGMSFINVKAEWTRGSDKDNGGYGLYPVQCTNVLIDHCTAVGASDAGIYVGQSKYIIVKNSKAYQNVAGIEIENSWYADVYDNEAYDNTGGILVFDLPDLIQKEGGYVRVFRNNIHDNNHINFAPKGNTVGKVPQGTGLMILATRHVEAFDNKIVNNITASTAIVSYYMTENPINDKSYNPFPSDIYIHDNYYERPRVKATGKGRMGKMYRFKLRFGKDVPHIQYDGIVDKKMTNRNICIRNNTNASFVNIDAENGFKNKSRDVKPHECEQQPISPVVLTAR